MKPLNNYLLLQIEDENKQTQSGLYVPQSTTLNATDILKLGTVVAKSIEIKKDISVGDKVYYNKNAITNVPNDKEHVLVRVEDLYAIV